MYLGVYNRAGRLITKPNPNFPPHLSLASSMSLFIRQHSRRCSATFYLCDNPTSVTPHKASHTEPMLDLYLACFPVHELDFTTIWKKKPQQASSGCWMLSFSFTPYSCQACCDAMWPERTLSCCLGLHGSRLSGWVLNESQPDSRAEWKIACSGSSRTIHQFKFSNSYCTREVPKATFIYMLLITVTIEENASIFLKSHL